MGDWKGRIIGFAIGFLFINPLSAVIGFLIGYFFYDKPSILRRRQSEAYAHTQKFTNYQGSGKISSIDFLSLTFALAGYVARGAGVINKEHINKATAIMNVMDLSKEMRRIAIDSFNRGKSEGFSLNDEIASVKVKGSISGDMISYLLEIEVQIALADGIVSPLERQRLLEIAYVFSIPEQDMDKLIRIRFVEMQFAKFTRDFGNGSFGGGQGQDYSQDGFRQKATEDEILQAYEILGVSKDASFEEIKRAHKRLMLKYHPDRLESQGLSPEMVKLYTEKAKNIQAAFDLIKKHKGID